MYDIKSFYSHNFLLFKDNLKSQVDGSQTVHSIDQLNSNVVKIFESLKNDRQPTLDHGDVSYIVWVTCSEVYQESIYDLLVPRSANLKQTPLKLVMDEHKNVYVKGILMILSR